jgi:outer membrane lipoprotein LolB
MRLPLVFLAAVLGAGCATAPKPDMAPDSAWEVRQEALSELRQWQLGGRIAVRTEEEAAHGRLQWRQEGERFDVRISGPFGSGTVRLAGDPAGAILWLDRQEPIRSADPEILLYGQTGWWIPVGALRYWVLGMPAPQLEYDRKLDAYGRIELLRQAGWEIRFLDYEQRDGLELPGRIFVSKGSGEVKVVVQRWNMAPEPPAAVGVVADDL